MQKFSFISQSNLPYIEEQYQSFLKNPDTVPSDWRLFFEGIEFAKNINDGSSGLSEKELNVYNLIEAYRDYGHYEANLDPLTTQPPSSPELSLSRFNLTDADLEQTFQVGSVIGLGPAKLSEIIQHLRKAYCQSLTVQAADCLPRVRQWILKEFEHDLAKFTLSNDEKKKIYEQVTRTETLEKFLHTRFVGAKRFSIEGGDAMIPMLERLVVKGATLGVEEIVIGMAHRGRLNVLANFMDKAIEVIFSEFSGSYDETIPQYDGDVKYHLGFFGDKNTPNGPVHVNLAFNPSHLEAVNTVVTGMARAKQRRRKDTEQRKKVVSVLIHGDAAFAGQGVVAETLQMSQLPGYKVGGTVHIIVDNQVGFTTDPENARSTVYSSDVAKAQGLPVLHVNGDDVEACVKAMDIAIRFRQEFGQDIVINMLCYRRFGHNEGDEPAYTQPLMYENIKAHPTLRDIYGKKLMKEGSIDQAFYDGFYQEKMNNLQAILDKTKASPVKVKPLQFEGLWKGLRRGTKDDFEKPTDTRADMKNIFSVGELLTTVPQNINVHPKLKKIIEDRKALVDKGTVDWGLGELLAYGTLMKEGTSVRLSGQDCGRGTFSHRHSVYHDVKTGELFVPLKTINPEKVEYCVYDSPLSEMGVLGFEYGNAISDPTFLTIWEAQFGDFANGAQIIIDQFISSGETKWYRMNGLVLLLPHGYEGQGPEHSSARLERFLQLCAQENMQVCNLTLPKQLFHVLRRQVKRDFRKPLVIMSPKSLLRHPKVISSIEDLANGTFEEVLPETTKQDASKVEKVVLVSGKLYFELLEARDKDEKLAKNTAIVRVEQLYPYPAHKLNPLLMGYKNLKKLVWAQEEPANMGANYFIRPELEKSLQETGLEKVKLMYAGRNHRASPATGSPYVHQKEQKALIEEALNC